MKKLIIYGLGSFSKILIKDFIKKKKKISFIIDQKSQIKSFYGIAVKKIIYLNKLKLNEYDCLIALHNHYININTIYNNLLKKGFNKIYSTINFPNINNIFSYKNSYWLNKKYKYKNHIIKKLSKILKDKKSRDLLKEVVNYRNTGLIYKCPKPEIYDEYIPKKITRYPKKISLIDCGAYTGQVIINFIKKKYQINNLIAFEPDKYNFKKLLKIKNKIKNAKIYQYGVYNLNKKLSFNSTSNLNSSIQTGNRKNDCEYVKFVKLDDYSKNFKPNVIKYDVEGAEIEALKGSKKTIFKYQPELCISIYHKHDHLYKIPLMINSWKLNYDFYLRLHEHNTFGLVLYCFKKIN
jgi:FkbM family methyltransferase